MGVALSSLTDAARIIGVHGIRATMTEALPALIKNLRAAEISLDDARRLGAVTERVLQSRLATLAELNNPYAHGSPFERFMSNTSSVFTKMTGLGWLNDTLKSVAAILTQDRMMRNSLNWAGAGKRERAYMAMLGIDEDMAGRIAGQFRKYGIEEDGIYGANATRWDDEVAKRAWAAALNKDVDRTIVTKGVADAPLWTKTNLGRLVTQFKSFTLASHQRVLISGLQERAHRLAEQMLFGTALGMMVSWLKYIERNDVDEAERLLENPGLWIANGLDRSGVLAIPFEISNTVEKLGAPGITAMMQKIFGDEDQGGSVSRYASRGPIAAVGGPWLSIFDDLHKITTQLTQAEIRRSGVNAMLNQIPGGTLPGFRTAISVGLRPER